MAAYRQVYDSRHLQADCKEPGSAPEPYARQLSMGYLYLFYNAAFTFIAELHRITVHLFLVKNYV